jgi:hypothetical protein
MSLAESDLLQAGDTVMITGGDLQRMVTLQARSLTKLGRVPHVNLGSLIGQPAGVMYEVDENTRTLVPYTGPTSEDAHEAAVDAETGGTGDNRHLLDSSNSQAMTQDEIEAIKAAEGVRGIVEKLCQSSATFNAKTAFSQQKYIRRKKKKYMVTFTVERVTPDTFCEMWCPTRRNEVIPESDTRWVRLRVDALAQLMSLANIHAGSRVLLVEKTNGFIPAAILSRLGDDGSIFHVLGHNAHATFTNARNIGLTDFRRRWKLLRRASLLDPTAPEHPAEKQNRVPWAGGAQSPEPPAANRMGPRTTKTMGWRHPTEWWHRRLRSSRRARSGSAETRHARCSRNRRRTHSSSLTIAQISIRKLPSCFRTWRLAAPSPSTAHTWNSWRRSSARCLKTVCASRCATRSTESTKFCRAARTHSCT